MAKKQATEKAVKPGLPETTVKAETAPESISVPKVEGLAAAAPSMRSSQASEPAKDKILTTLTDNREIDLSSMREKTREKFVDAVRRTPGLLPASSGGESAGLAVPDEAVSALYNIIGIGETVIASSRFPQEIAAAAFMWNRDEIAAIRNPTKALIAKHAGKLRGWEEETTWALVFAQIHFSKVSTLRALMEEYTAKQAAERARVDKTPGPKPTDIPGNVSPGDSPVPPIPEIQ